jgi:hypothetical protein
VTYSDFAEVTLCGFWKITVDHRDSDISSVIPNTNIMFLPTELNLSVIKISNKLYSIYNLDVFNYNFQVFNTLSSKKKTIQHT